MNRADYILVLILCAFVLVAFNVLAINLNDSPMIFGIINFIGGAICGHLIWKITK